jgi:hypothetical protein
MCFPPFWVIEVQRISNITRALQSQGRREIGCLAAHEYRTAFSRGSSMQSVRRRADTNFIYNSC